MRLAVMQPYFFPYLGYFSLIAATDQFVVFDPVQFIRHGWINRNRILKPCLKESQYIRVPLVRHSRTTKIRDVRIADSQPWRTRLLAQLQHYKKNAGHFEVVLAILERCLQIETDSIVELNVHCLQVLCEELGLTFRPVAFADIEHRVEPVNDAGEWALHTAIALNADVYLNPMGGKELFDRRKFAAHSIQLGFVEPDLKAYSQRNTLFQPGLSIIDVLMFNGIKATRELIDEYQITF